MSINCKVNEINYLLISLDMSIIFIRLELGIFNLVKLYVYHFTIKISISNVPRKCLLVIIPDISRI